MMHLVANAVNPKLSLKECVNDWKQISYELRESTRERKYQMEYLGFL